MTQNQKLEWLRKHDYEVDKLTGTDQVTWQAWDTSDYDGYRIITPTKNEAVNKAYEYLKAEILSKYDDLLDCIDVSAKSSDWKAFDFFLIEMKQLIVKMDK